MEEFHAMISVQSLEGIMDVEHVTGDGTLKWCLGKVIDIFAGTSIITFFFCCCCEKVRCECGRISKFGIWVKAMFTYSPLFINDQMPIE